MVPVVQVVLVPLGQLRSNLPFLAGQQLGKQRKRELSFLLCLLFSLPSPHFLPCRHYSYLYSQVHYLRGSALTSLPRLPSFFVTSLCFTAQFWTLSLGPVYRPYGKQQRRYEHTARSRSKCTTQKYTGEQGKNVRSRFTLKVDCSNALVKQRVSYYDRRGTVVSSEGTSTVAAKSCKNNSRP